MTIALNGYQYRCVATNSSGSTNSTAAVLTVNATSPGTVVAWGSNSNGQTTVPAGLSGVTAIAAGDAHTVALKSDGTVVAWGDNWAGQTIVPAGLSGVRAIAAGSFHTVVLKSDGTVVAWGDNHSGQTIVPTGLSGVAAIAAGGNATGDNHTVALIGTTLDRTVLKGDINGNGTIDLTDAVVAMQILSRVTPAQPINKNADIDGDGKIGLPEVIFILQRAVDLR